MLVRTTEQSYTDKMYKKTINKFALENLKPLGFVQLGDSRTWFVDRGDYLVVLNFESSGTKKGTYIDIGLNFLWNPKNYISYDFFFNGNTRITPFIEYQSEDQFKEELDKVLKITLITVDQYLNIKDMKTLSDLIVVSDTTLSSESWLVFHKAVLEGLVGNIKTSEILFNNLIKSDEISNIPWNIERLNESMKLISSLKDSRESFASLISEKVSGGREMLKI